MANITEEHLHHMARRHHATMKKLDAVQERFAGMSQRTVNTLEAGAGAWIGGTLEGKTGGASLGPIPLNLGIGIAMIAASHIPAAAQFSDHLNNVGNGFVSSYLAATGYAFGKRWRETGKMFGGGAGNPWTQPYENGWPTTPGQAAAQAAQQFTPPPPAVVGNLDEATMAAIVQRMQAAAAAPAYQ